MPVQPRKGFLRWVTKFFMSNKIIQMIVYVLVLVGLLGLLYFLSEKGIKSREEVASVASLLMGEISDVDFGTVSMARGKVSQTYNVQNTSSEPITIKKMYTSCMCTQAILKKGAKTFGPMGMPGHGLLPSMDVLVLPGEKVQLKKDPQLPRKSKLWVGRVVKLLQSS